LEFNVPFQHKYGYIRDENTAESHTNYTQSIRRKLRICTADVLLFILN